MERLMSDGYPFIFQMIDKSESDEYLNQTIRLTFCKQVLQPYPFLLSKP